VLLIFDQLRGDYPQRWGELFDQGGFRRFLDEGAWFKECIIRTRHPHRSGHATVAVGASPDRHGIVGNNWYDRSSKVNVYCGNTEYGYQRVPGRRSAPTARRGRRPAVRRCGCGRRHWPTPSGRVAVGSCRCR